MTDSTAGNDSAAAKKKFDIHELPSFRSYPLGFAVLAILLGILGLLLPYATLSVSIFDSGLKPFNSAGNSAWFLSIPIGWIALLTLVVGIGSVFAQLSGSHTHKSGTTLGIVTLGAGVAGVAAIFFELFFVSDKVSNSLLGSSIQVSPGTGYFVLLLAMSSVILAGVMSLVHFDGKRHGR